MCRRQRSVRSTAGWIKKQIHGDQLINRGEIVRNSEKKKRKRFSLFAYLKLHPGEEIAGLAPAAELVEHEAHLAEGELRDERRHGLAHVGGGGAGAGRRGARRADGGDHVAAVHVAGAVVLDVAGHLVRGAADPRGVCALPLPPALAAEALRLVVEEAPVRALALGGGGRRRRAG